MKAFRYRLQAVQRLRDRREHEATECYAGALARRASAFQHLEAADRELARGHAECSRLLNDGAPAADIRQRQLFSVWLQERRDLMAKQLDEAEIQLNHALGQMISARRESEAVQKHHDRARELHQGEVQRDEQKWLDDLPTLRTAPGLLS